MSGVSPAEIGEIIQYTEVAALTQPEADLSMPRFALSTPTALTQVLFVARTRMAYRLFI
jgi:hypothetical protein